MSEFVVDVARVDGTALHAPGVVPAPDELRQRACTEMLRRAAQRAGLLSADDAASCDGVVSEAAAAAIEALLERELRVPEPSVEACRRHYEANPARFGAGERVLARHLLFAVTPGVDVHALTSRAEQMLLALRCHDAGDDRFALAARENSNCPSGADGGALGWLRAADCAPEFGCELFGQPEVGVLPRLVRSRFGLHVVEVLARDPGEPLPWEEVSEAVALALRRQSWANALRQYLRLLAGQAQIDGVDLEGAITSPSARPR